MNNIRTLCIICASAFLLSACGAQSSVQIEAKSEIQTEYNEKTDMPETASELFTERDMRNEYSIDAEIDLNTANAENGCIRITEKGTYLIKGSFDGSIEIEADENAKIQLVLDGAEIYASSTPAINIISADKVFITTAPDSTNVLRSGVEKDSSDFPDAAVFSRCDLTLNGLGSLSVISDNAHAIVCKDDLKICSGNYNIEAAYKGLSGKDSISVGGGTIYINSGTDALHSGNDEKGTVNIIDGSIEISSGDDGIHAEKELTIYGGAVNIIQSYEGLEAAAVRIFGGEINIVSSDDGINAASGNGGEFPGGFGRGGDMFADTGAELVISGGRIFINADGDGVDSNGSLLVSGGELYVSGPVNGANGALDYNTSGAVTGGIVIAVGAVGMDSGFDCSSTQASMRLRLSGTAGDEISLLDDSGRVIAAYTAEKSFSSVVISSPELTVGNTYTVKIGSSTSTITLSELIYSEGGDFGGFGGRPGGMGGMPGGDFGRRPDMPTEFGGRPDGQRFG